MGSSDGSFQSEGSTFGAERDASGALASARAAPDKLTTNLTLSSAEHRRLPSADRRHHQCDARAGLNAGSMTGQRVQRQAEFRGCSYSKNAILELRAGAAFSTNY